MILNLNLIQNRKQILNRQPANKNLGVSAYSGMSVYGAVDT